MVKRKVKLANVSGWAGTAAGAFNAHTVVLDIPVGPRYHVIWIYGNAGAAKKFTDLIGEIRVKINGQTQRQFTGTELLKLNMLNGSAQWAGRNGNVAATAFYIPIWLAEPWRKSLRSQDALAWGTGDVGTFQIEFDIIAYAGAAAGLIAPTFEGEIDNSIVGKGQSGGDVQQPLGLITKWVKTQIPITAANAVNEFGGLKDLNGAIQSIHLSDANLSAFELKVDNSTVREDTVGGNAAGLAGREMNPDPAASNDCPARAMYDIVMDHDDVLENALPLALGGKKVGSVQLKLTENGGAVSRNISTIVQVIGNAD